MRLLLPPEFLPCIDDWERLTIMADYVYDSVDGWQYPECPLTDHERHVIAGLLRWTANEWKWGCLRRDEVQIGGYFLRWKTHGPVMSFDQGVSRVILHSVDRTTVVVAHTTRHGQKREAAWWDLTPDLKGKPKQKRRGWWIQTNAKLAEFLCISPDEARARIEPEQPKPAETTSDDSFDQPIGDDAGQVQLELFSTSFI